MQTTRNTISVKKEYILNDRVITGEDVLAYGGLVNFFISELIDDKGLYLSALITREDMYQEGLMYAYMALKRYDRRLGVKESAFVGRVVRDGIMEYVKRNAQLLSGATHGYNLRRKAGPDASVEDLMALGASRKTAVGALMLNKIPSGYGAAFNMIDHGYQKKIRDFEISQFDWRQYLTADEIFIIEHIYGMNDKDVMTFENIGAHINKSRKAVSYAHECALRKLRHVNGIEDMLFK